MTSTKRRTISTFRRVQIFVANEVHETTDDKNWFRSDEFSDELIATTINKWLVENEATLVSVTTPAVQLIRSDPPTESDEARHITYRVSISIIYIPNEVIHDNSVTEEEVHAEDQHVNEGVNEAKEEKKTQVGNLHLTDTQLGGIADAFLRKFTGGTPAGADSHPAAERDGSRAPKS